MFVAFVGSLLCLNSQEVDLQVTGDPHTFVVHSMKPPISYSLNVRNTEMCEFIKALSNLKHNLLTPVSMVIPNEVNVLLFGPAT